MVATTTRSQRLAILTLAAALLLLSAACGPLTVTQSTTDTTCVPQISTGSVPPPTSGHPSYARTPCGPVPLKVVWHPGETVQYQWRATLLNPQPDGGNAPVLLTFDVFGPYPSYAAAEAAQHRLGTTNAHPFLDPTANPPSTPTFPSPPVASASPIHTDTWSAQTYTTTLQLPTTLTPGYYVLLLSDIIGESATPNTNAPIYTTNQASAIVQVVIP